MSEFGWLFPEGVSVVAAALVVFASFFTAALTASFGLGGGLALLAVMGALFPPAALIPIHGVAQLGANSSRFLLQRRDVDWPIAIWFASGCALGAAIGARLYVEVPENLLKGAVGLFILFAVWGPKPRGFSPGPRSYFATGAIGSILSVFFGATGPIAASMLSAARLDKLRTVATHAACMVAQHALKTIAFGFVGFAFADWGVLIVAIILAGFAGSAAGTVLLRRMPEQQFRKGFTLILTFLACYLIGDAVLN